MPTLEFQIACLIQELEDGVVLAEPLLFPEICCHGRTAGEAKRHVLERVSAILASEGGLDPKIKRSAIRRSSALVSWSVSSSGIPPRS